jgi:hypothetical protein
MLSGLTEKTARKGIKDLEGFPGFSVCNFVTARGRRAKKYKLTFPPAGETGRVFFFHKEIFEGGNWCRLKPVAQALYPVMRFYGRFDGDMYLEVEDIERETEEDYTDFFKRRRWECCEAELPLMQKYAGISSRQSVYEALADLNEPYLIGHLEEYSDGVKRYKVFLSPPTIYKPSWLNNNVRSKYLRPDSDRPKFTGHAVQKKKKTVQKRGKVVQNLPCK